MKYGHARRLHHSRSSRRSRADLRDRATPAERALLAALDRASEPHAFQYVVRTAEAPTGYYVVDFYLPRRFLFVELDGKPHASEQAQWNDRLRTEAILRALPTVSVVRLWNSDVLSDPDAAVVRLLASALLGS